MDYYSLKGRGGQILAEVLGGLAYLPLFQGFLFQANYYRDPTRVEGAEYLENSQLARWNNEGVVNEQYRARFLLSRQVVAVKALRDAVVWPVIAQQFGAPAPGQWTEIQNMRQTRWCPPPHPPIFVCVVFTGVSEQVPGGPLRAADDGRRWAAGLRGV